MKQRKSRPPCGQCLIWSAAPLLGSLLLTACSSLPALSPFGDRRLDILTDFVIAVENDDFNKALQLMAPDEREKFADEDGDIRPQFEERLRTLKPARLNSHPFIKIERGKIKGLYDLLPTAGVSSPSGKFGHGV